MQTAQLKLIFICVKSLPTQNNFWSVGRQVYQFLPYTLFSRRENTYWKSWGRTQVILLYKWLLYPLGHSSLSQLDWHLWLVVVTKGSALTLLHLFLCSFSGSTSKPCLISSSRATKLILSSPSWLIFWSGAPGRRTALSQGWPAKAWASSGR